MGWLSKLFNLDAIEDTKPVMSTAQLKNSSADARNRLKLVLMHDRTQLAPETIEKMRDELITVISKYVEIDKDALRLDLETESNTIALVANIPVLRARESWGDEDASETAAETPAPTATIHTASSTEAATTLAPVTTTTETATPATPSEAIKSTGTATPPATTTLTPPVIKSTSTEATKTPTPVG